MKNYIKKFSVMFFILLAIIGIGAIQNENLVNAATSYTRGTQYLNALDGYHRYDDNDLNIAYSDNFITFSTNKAETKAYASLLYKSDRHELVQGSGKGTIKFSFSGTSLVLLEYLYNNRTQNSTISFDGGKTSEICSAYVNTSAPIGTVTINSPQTAFYVKEGLDNKRHDVVINIPASDSAGFCLDAIDVDGNILPYNESITLDKSSMNLTEGDSQQLTATTTPAAVGVTWTSSDSSIATVDSNGKVTAIKEGQATITATTSDGSNLSASCTVNVEKKDEPATPTDPATPTEPDNTKALLIINLTDGETKVFDVTNSEVGKFKQWYNTKSEFENKLTYEFDKTVNSNISIEEDVVHDQITSYEIRKY